MERTKEGVQERARPKLPLVPQERLKQQAWQFLGCLAATIDCVRPTESVAGVTGRP